MSGEYAEKRIREALKKTGGDAARARRQVIAWTYEDPKLLHALTKAHLSGIVAYNIERILSGRSSAGQGEGKKPSVAKAPPAKAAPENFGKEILKAIAGNDGALFGMEGYGGTPRKKPQKVSQGHIDAIKALTGKKPPRE